MDRIQKISHKGKEITVIDFSHLSNKEIDQIMNLIQSVNSTIPTYPLKSVLTLTKVEDLFFNREIMAAFKASQEKIKAYQRKAAVVGVHGLQKLALDAIAILAGEHDTKIFKTVEEATDWLVE